MWTMLEERLFEPLRSDRTLKAALPRIEAEVAAGRLAPAAAVEEIAGCWSAEAMRVLLTGFGPFPGAPFNPSARFGQSARPQAAAGSRRFEHRACLCHELCGSRSRSAETLRGTSRTSFWCLGSPAAGATSVSRHVRATPYRYCFPMQAATARRRALSSLADRRRLSRATRRLPNSWARSARAKCRFGRRATPGDTSATTSIGAPWNERPS